MIDVNQPVTNPELVEAMAAFFKDKNADNESVLIRCIKEAHFLAPIVLEGTIEEGVLKAGGLLNFKMITNSAEDSFFLAFTDWEELRKWSAAEEQTLITTYSDLSALTMKTPETAKGFVINPFTQNLLITQDLMRYFDQRMKQVEVKADTVVRLGQPAVYPQALVDALSAHFKKQKTVEQCFLFLAQKDGDEKPQLLLIVDFAGSKEATFDQIAKVSQPFLSEGNYIDMMPLEGDFAKDAIRNIKPFYQRKKWGFFS